MSAHLKAHNIWSFVEPRIQERANVTTQRRDQLTLSQILLGIDYSIFGQITHAKTAKEACNILKLSYKGVDKV